jgi:glutamyl-tRNA synthetase
VNQSNARFDEKKLAHINRAYVAQLPAERYVELARAFFGAQQQSAALADPEHFRRVMLLGRAKQKVFEELPAYTPYFFTDDFPVDPKARDKVMAKGDPKARLHELAAALPGIDFSSGAAIQTGIEKLAAEHGLGFGDYQAAARLAVSGTNVGPELTEMFCVLGRDRVLRRIERFLSSAG